jgi:hypothetical protein
VKAAARSLQISHVIAERSLRAARPEQAAEVGCFVA